MFNRIVILSLALTFIISGTSQAYFKNSSSSKKDGADNDLSAKLYDDDMKAGKVEMKSESLEKSGTMMDTVLPSDMKEGYVKTSIAYPTGKENTSTVLLEKHFPAKGIVGREYSYMIKITNLTDLTVENVNVSEIIPDNYTVISSEPQISNKMGTKASWKIGSLAPRGSSVITVKGKSNDKISSPCCAQVQYDVPALCHKVILEQPNVAIKVDAPKEALSCDLIELVYTVENTGDNLLKDLSVKTELPDGITTSSGNSMVEFPVFSLDVGESKEIKEIVQADDPGQYRFSGSVKGEYVSGDAMAVFTKVVKPSVTVDIKAKRIKQYLGREIGYTIEVKNTSAVDAQSTMVVAEIPKNAEFKSASHEGRQVENIVGWEVGTLKAFETKKLELTLNSIGQGMAKTKVGVQAACCDPITDTAETELVGIPALLLEVVDMIDPIEVGEEETYVIKVTNQGTANANNVKISASFDGMDYVSSDGETMGMLDLNMLNFSPVKTIGSKENVSWKVKVKGNKEGDLRFKVILNSDELTQPVEEAESTFVY
ncbi:MAG: hypothetical protein AB7S78_03900 [Candidatus Omnitrophota bacterium]